MKALVVSLIVLLAVLHHDVWWWDDRTVLFGFLPVGLAWHMGISIAAGVVGWLAVKFCWPRELEAMDRGDVRGPNDAGESREQV